MRKRLIFLLPILLTFLLILCSSIGNAQCAWVLWMSTQDGLNKKPERWSIVFAVPDFETCIANLEKSKKEAAENFKKIPNLVTSTDENVNSIITVTKNGELTIFSFKCLPDTLDPRK